MTKAQYPVRRVSEIFSHESSSEVLAEGLAKSIVIVILGTLIVVLLALTICTFCFVLYDGFWALLCVGRLEIGSFSECWNLRQ